MIQPTLRTLILLSSNALLATATIASPAPLLLVAAPNFNATRIDAICRQLPNPCDPATTSAFIGKKSSRNQVYLIDASRPALVIVDNPNSLRDQTLRAWDFADYQHSFRPLRDGETEPAVLQIYPALYPAGADSNAVAVISAGHEMYSGGGAWSQVADFLVLNAASDAEPSGWTVAYATVPFFCSKMVRACFWEKEYETSAHCHDEYAGSLRIKFPVDASAGWSFVWHETDWFAHDRPSQKQSSRTNFKLPRGPAATFPAPLPKTVSFCNTPVE